MIEPIDIRAPIPLRVGRYELIPNTDPPMWSVTIPDPQLYIDQLNELSGDAEISHDEAEKIVLRLLCEMGMEPVAAAFNAAKERVGFWYA